MADRRSTLRKRQCRSSPGEREDSGRNLEGSSGNSLLSRGRTLRSQKKLTCPVCHSLVDGNERMIYKHVEICLALQHASESDEENDLKLEEYEWAGQRRVRATALMEGPSDCFTSITRGDEDEVLDIEGDMRYRQCSPQYTMADIIFPEADTPQEQFERDSLLTILGHKKSTATNDSDIEVEEDTEEVDIESTEIDDLRKLVQSLKIQNKELKERTLCKVCMDAYEKPLVSLECWHAHCEQCWLRALGAKKLCPQCKVITKPEDLRRIYL